MNIAVTYRHNGIFNREVFNSVADAVTAASGLKSDAAGISKVQIEIQQISRHQLLKTLGLNTGKIPSSACGIWRQVNIPDALGRTVLISDVQLVQSNRGPKGRSRFGHRIFVHCPLCDRQFPFGKVAQHCKSH